MKVHNVRQVYSNLSPYCSFAKENDFISVTEWHNGEGFDVEISCDKRRELFQLTYGEFQALQVLVNYKE
jgi:hypothetical protein